MPRLRFIKDQSVIPGIGGTNTQMRKILEASIPPITKNDPLAEYKAAIEWCEQMIANGTYIDDRRRVSVLGEDRSWLSFNAWWKKR